MTRESDAMGDMEDMLGILQDDMAETVKPPRRHFKPSGFLLTVLVVIVVAVSSFVAATKLAAVSKNSDAIDQNCKLRNEAIAAYNKKFADLSYLFDVVLANQPPDQPPPAHEVLRLLEDFKKPVVATPCE